MNSYDIQVELGINSSKFEYVYDESEGRRVITQTKHLTNTIDEQIPYELQVEKAILQQHINWNQIKTEEENKMDKTLKDIVKREKESGYSGSNTSKSIRIMTKEIRREKSDDLIIVNLSDDGDSVRRIEKDSSKLTGLLKKGWEKIK